MILLILFLSFPYSTFFLFLYFGTKITWYRQYYLTWVWLCHFRIDGLLSLEDHFLLPTCTTGRQSLIESRRQRRWFTTELNSISRRIYFFLPTLLLRLSLLVKMSQKFRTGDLLVGECIGGINGNYPSPSPLTRLCRISRITDLGSIMMFNHQAGTN